MTRRHTKVPLAAMENILRSCGAIRVSEDARVEMELLVSEYAMGVGKLAVNIAHHAGRKTVMATDIRLASSK